MRKNILLVIILLLTSTIAVSFALPKKKYKSLDVLSKIEMPYRALGWKSKDVSQQFNPNDMRYNFIQRMLARAYWNAYGDTVIFMILDAGNFHNPKVCYGAAGYKFIDLPETELEVSGRKFKAVTVLFEKEKEKILVIYWLVINKKLVSWTQQKLIELWYSLTGKKKTGLMVRLEIPVRDDKIEEARRLAQTFLQEVGGRFSAEEAEYVFGKR